MPEEQIQVDEVVRLMREAKYSDEKIIDILISVIKTQMMMGGTLDEKLQFYKKDAQKHL